MAAANAGAGALAHEAQQMVPILLQDNQAPIPGGNVWHHRADRNQSHGESISTTQLILKLASSQTGIKKGLHPDYQQMLEGCPFTVVWGCDLWLCC